MKEGRTKGALLLLGAGALALQLLQLGTIRRISSLFSFPYEGLASGLRKLSLSGRTGNIVAFILYVLLCLLPLFVSVIQKIRRRSTPEDALLVLLSLMLFASMYKLINPGAFSSGVPGLSPPIIGSILHATLAGYFVLKFLRLIDRGAGDKLSGYLRLILLTLGAIFVLVISYVNVGTLISSLESVTAANQGNEHLLGTTKVFLYIKYFVESLPYVLNLLLVFSALSLLRSFEKERYSEATLTEAKKLSALSVSVLRIVILVSIGFQILQFLFMDSLRVINTLVWIPVSSIAFVLAALLFAKIIEDAHQLKDENESFV